MANAPRYQVPYAYAPDPTGQPIAGAWLYSFLGDSSTAAPTYADAALGTPNANPVVADATGTFPSIFLDPSIIYKFQLYYPSAAGGPAPFPPVGLVQVWSAYPVSADSAGNLNSYTATGGNAIVLTPFDGTPSITSYVDYQQFLFLAPATSTGNVTVQVSGLGILPLYVNGQQASAGQVLAGQLVVAVYVSSVNGTGQPAMISISAAALNAIITTTESGAANAYVLNPSPAVQSLSETQMVLLIPLNTNTGPSTLNISGIGAKAITNQAGNPITPSQLVASAVYLLTWNGTSFQLVNPTITGSAPFSVLTASSGGGVKTATFAGANATVADTAGNISPVGPFSLTGNVTVGGANGLDTGSVAAFTWYAVFVIYGANGLALLFSLSATAPTLPTGFSMKARVGWIRTDGSSNVVAFKQFGNRVQYVNTSGGLPSMASGAAGTYTTGVYVAVPVAAFVPSTAASISVNAVSSNSVVGIAPNNSYGAYQATTNPPPINVVVGSQQIGVIGELLLESTNLYWFSSTSAGTIFCLGWQDNF